MIGDFKLWCNTSQYKKLAGMKNNTIHFSQTKCMSLICFFVTIKLYIILSIIS